MNHFEDIELEQQQEQEVDGQSSADSFKKDYYQLMEKRKQQKKNLSLRRTKQQHFNYMQIRSADQVTQLIEKCQDSLDLDYINLFKAGKVLNKLIENKRLEFEVNERQPDIEVLNHDNNIDYSFDSDEFQGVEEVREKQMPNDFNA